MRATRWRDCEKHRHCCGDRKVHHLPDDDDTVYPDHLETLVSFLETSPQQVAYTDAIRVFQEKDGDQYVTKSREVFHSHDFHPDHILVANFMAIHCVMHERACFEVCGVFDDTLTSHQDLDLWIRMSRIFEFSHIKKVTAEFKKSKGKNPLRAKVPIGLKTSKNIYAKYAEYALPRCRNVNGMYWKNVSFIRSRISGRGCRASHQELPEPNGSLS